MLHYQLECATKSMVWRNPSSTLTVECIPSKRFFKIFSSGVSIVSLSDWSPKCRERRAIWMSERRAIWMGERRAIWMSDVALWNTIPFPLMSIIVYIGHQFVEEIIHSLSLASTVSLPNWLNWLRNLHIGVICDDSALSFHAVLIRPLSR
jgi:hypothetical protein